MQVTIMYLLVGNTSSGSETLGVFSASYAVRDHLSAQTHDNPFSSFTVRRLVVDYPGEGLDAYFYDKSDTGPGWVRRG